MFSGKQMRIPQKIRQFTAWSQENPRAISLWAKLFHYAFAIRQHLPGRKGFLLIFTGGIGDLVSLTPALRGLARHHPGVPISFLVKGDMICDSLKACPYLTQVVPFHIYESTPCKWWELFKACWKMEWRHRYTTAILAMGTGWIPQYRIWALLLLYATGARRRLAFRDECDVWRHTPDPVPRLPLANETLPASQRQRTDRFMEFFRKAGLIDDEDEPAATEIWTSDEDIREAAQLDDCFAGHGDGEPVVLVFPGVGSGPGKRWPPGRYVKLIEHLRATYRARVFLDGMEHDHPLCKTIAALTSPCRNLAGSHSGRALFALIRRANLVIASDSGPIHIAAATGTPAIAIFGPTDPRVWAPHSAQLTILRKSECPPCDNPYYCQRERDFACTSEVTTADAINACESILRKFPSCSR